MISIFQLCLYLDKSIKGNAVKFLIIYNGSNTKNHLSSFLKTINKSCLHYLDFKIGVF